MKVLVLTLLMVAVAVAVPVEFDSNDESQLTLIDLDNEQSANDGNAPEVARSKRFILKKIALLKAGALGVGALGLAGAVAAKSAVVGGIGGFGSPNRIPQQGYGYNSGLGYGYNSGASLTTSYPSTYVTSQTYVPQQTFLPPQPQPQYPATVSYGPPPAPSHFGGPINSALAWKTGMANNIASGISNGISSGFSGFASSSSFVPSAPGYAYGAPPPVPAAAIAPVPNKPLYVVCDNHN